MLSLLFAVMSCIVNCYELSSTAREMFLCKININNRFCRIFPSQCAVIVPNNSHVIFHTVTDVSPPDSRSWKL